MLLFVVEWRQNKDLLTVDPCSVCLLSGVDIVIRYIEVDFTFGLLDYVRYIFYAIPFSVTLAGT